MIVKPSDAAAIDRPLTWAAWASVLEPHGFKPASHTMDRALWDRQTMYFLQLGSLVKVGITRDVQARVRAFRLGCPRGLYLRATRDLPALFARQAEQQVHAALRAHARGREWFKIGPGEARKAAQPIIDRSWDAVRALDAAGYDQIRADDF